MPEGFGSVTLLLPTKVLFVKAVFLGTISVVVTIVVLNGPVASISVLAVETLAVDIRYDATVNDVVTDCGLQAPTY